MPNYGARIGHATTRPVTFDPDADRLAQVFDEFGHNADKRQTETLHELCSKYLNERLAELSDQPVSLLQNYLERVQKAVNATTPFAYGQLLPLDTASRRLEQIIDEQLGMLPVNVALSAQEDRENSHECITDDGSQVQAMLLDMNFLMNAFIALNTALSRAGKVIDQEEKAGEPGFVPGEAFNQWARDLQDWARKNNFIHGTTASNRAEKAKRDGSAPRFYQFALSLHQMFPADLCDQIDSVEAMRKRISRACSDACA